MYKLILADGSELSNLERLNPSTFQLKSTDSQIYWQLSDDNLAFATLYNDDELDDILMNYTRNSYYAQNGIIQFRIIPTQAQVDESSHQADKARKSKSKQKFMEAAEKEMEKKGW